MAEEIFHFTHGGLKGIIFNEKNRASSADQMYSSVPDNERERVIAEFGLDGNVPSAINVLLIDTGAEKILIDTGLGQGALYAGLESEGIGFDEINHIIVTHGHGDHLGDAGAAHRVTAINSQGFDRGSGVRCGLVFYDPQEEFDGLLSPCQRHGQQKEE